MRHPAAKTIKTFTAFVSCLFECLLAQLIIWEIPNCFLRVYLDKLAAWFFVLLYMFYQGLAIISLIWIFPHLEGKSHNVILHML